MAELNPEWLARRLVEAAGDGILFADRGGVIRAWNAGAAAIFGWSEAEALGQTLDLIVPEPQRERHWKGWDQVLETGTTRYGRDLLAVPALRKDGARISIEFTIQIVRDDAGAVLGFGAIVRDVTARWQREKELRARLKALEVAKV